MIIRRIAIVAGSAGWLLTVGCATKSDIRLLQDELRATRAAIAASDEARRAQADSMMLVTVRAEQRQRRLEDSIRVMGARLNVFQANTNQTLFNIGERVLELREQTTALGGRITDVRAAWEAQQQQVEAATAAAARVPPPTNPPAGGAAPVTGGAAPGAAQPPTEGAATLFTTARDQLQRQSCVTARGGFEQVLASYPNDPLVPDAIFSIAATYECEGKPAAADSVYASLVQRFPRSEWAPTALYKRADALDKAGRASAALPIFNRLIREYPRSDAAQLACGRLNRNPCR